MLSLQNILRKRKYNLSGFSLVIIESPYAGNIEKNVEYARACVRDSILRDEAPIASHLLYTQPGILKDEDPEERLLGISCGLAWRHVADKAIFYTDLGMSSGMKHAMGLYASEKFPVEIRTLGEKWQDHS